MKNLSLIILFLFLLINTKNANCQKSEIIVFSGNGLVIGKIDSSNDSNSKLLKMLDSLSTVYSKLFRNDSILFESNKDNYNKLLDQHTIYIHFGKNLNFKEIESIKKTIKHGEIYLKFPTKSNVVRTDTSGKHVFLSSDSHSTIQKIKTNLENGEWEIFSLLRGNTDFQKKECFTILNSEINGYFNEYEDGILVEQRKYNNGILVDTLFKYYSDTLYHMSIRSHYGYLISDISYYLGTNKVKTYTNYKLNISFNFNIYGKISHLFEMNNQEFCGRIIEFDEEMNIKFKSLINCGSVSDK